MSDNWLESRRARKKERDREQFTDLMSSENLLSRWGHGYDYAHKGEEGYTSLSDRWKKLYKRAVDYYNNDAYTGFFDAYSGTRNKKGYVSDTGAWYSDLEGMRDSANEGVDELLAELDQYSRYYNEDAVSYVRDLIAKRKSSYDDIMTDAGRFRDTMSQWATEDDYNNAVWENDFVKAYNAGDYDKAETMLKEEVYKLKSKFENDAFGLTTSEEYGKLLEYGEDLEQARLLADFQPFKNAIEAGDLETAETLLNERTKDAILDERSGESRATTLLRDTADTAYNVAGTLDNIVKRSYQRLIGVEESPAKDDTSTNYYHPSTQAYWDILNFYKDKKAYKENNAEYLALMENEDFAENSKYKTTKTGEREIDWFATIGTNLMNSILAAQQGSQTVYKDGQGYSDIIYDIINGNPEAKNYADSQNIQDWGALAVASGLASTEYLTELKDDEKKIFNYLYATEGKERAYEYISHLEKNYLNERSRATIEEEWAKLAHEAPVLTSLLTIGTAPARGISFLAQTADFLDDFEIQDNARYNQLLYTTNAIRNQVSKDIEASGKWGEVGSFAYGVGMSMGDFLTSTVAGFGNANAVGLIMATGAAADTTLQGIDRGLDSTRAYLMGTIAGATEFFTEKMGVENLLDKALLSKSKFAYVLKNALSEGAEEGLTDVINWAADYLYDLISGQSKSEWKAMIAEYEAMGYTSAEAFGKAIGDRMSQLGTDVLAGAVSGGIMGGAGAAFQAIGEYKEGAKYKSDPSGLINNALGLDPDSEYAQKLQDKLDAGKKVGQGALGKLSFDMQESVRTKLLERDANTKQQFIADVEKKLSTQIADKQLRSQMADTLTKIAYGEHVSNAELRKISQSQKGLNVLEDVIGTRYKAGNVTVSELRKAISSRQDSAARLSSENVLATYAALFDMDEIAERSLMVSYATDVKNAEGGKVANPEDYAVAYNKVYAAGKKGTDISEIAADAGKVLSQSAIAQAYRAGQNAGAAQISQKGLSNGLDSGTINTVNKEAQNGQGLYLRDGGEWNDGTNPGGQVSAVEGNAGQNKGRGEGRTGPRDSEASSLSYDREVSAKELVKGGLESSRVWLPTEGSETASMKEARKIAESRGLKVVFFGGGNLKVLKGSKIISARAYIQGDTVYVRVDHAGFAADQLMKHEAAHDMIDKGEINVADVKKLISERFTPEEIDAVINSYAIAYKKAGMTADEIWEEVICDSVAEMNSFEGTDFTAAAEMAADFLPDLKEAVLESKKESRGPPKNTESQGHASYAGENAETADIMLLSDAKEMLAAGVDSETIRKETGWFKSYDSKWRFEIDDSTAIWHLDTAKPDPSRLFNFGERIFKLSDILDHPALYKAYPQLKNVTVWENPNSPVSGYVVGRSTDAITMQSLKNTEMNKDLIIHEIQHLIQNIEGFAAGAAVTQFDYKAWGDKEYAAYEKRNEIASKLYAILRRHGVSIKKTDVYAVRTAFEIRDSIIDYNFMLIESLADNNESTRALLDEYYKQVQILNLTTPEGQYHAVPGEIEAHDAQARRRKTSEERKNTRPNIDREDVVFASLSDTSYAVKRDDRGREYWEIDSGKDILKGLSTPEEYRDAAFAFLIANRDNKVVVKDNSGKEIIFIRLSAEEFTQSRESQDLFNDHPTMFEQKMRLIPSLDDILLHSNVNWRSPDHKKHKLFKKNGFENYRGRVRIDNVIFNTIVRVGKANFGDVFYDINLEVDSYLPHASNGASDIKEPTSTANSISQKSKMSTDFQEKNSGGFGKTSQDLDFFDFLSENAEDSTAAEAQQEMSNREILANALESVVSSESDKRELRKYKSRVKALDSMEAELSEVNAKIRELSFAPGPRDKITLNELKKKKTELESAIQKKDKSLIMLEATAPLQSVLDRAKKQAVAKAKEEARVKMDAQKERAREALDKQAKRYQESRKKSVEGRHKTEMRHKIQRVVSELDKLLRKGNKERNVKLGLQDAVAAALEAFDINAEKVARYERDMANLDQKIAEATDPIEIEALQALRDKKQRNSELLADKLLVMKKAYEDIHNNAGDVNYPAHYRAEAKVIGDRISSVLEKVGNVPISEMSLEQLESIYDMYRMVLTTVRDANKAFINGKLEDLSENAADMTAELQKIKKLPEERLRAGDDARGFVWNELTPYYAFKRIGSATFMRYYDELVRGQDVYARDLEEAKRFASETRKKYGYGKWKLDEVHNFKDKDGRKFDLTLKHMMSIYAYSKREQALDHMEKGGFFFNNKETFRKKGGVLEFIASNESGYKVDASVFAQIKAALTPEQIAYVDEMQAYLTKMGEKGNEVTRQMWGIDIFKEKVYFPLKSKEDFIYQANTPAETSSLKNDGMTKETKPHASNPIVLESFDEVWANHVNKMSMYHGFVIPIDNLNKLINYGTWMEGNAQASNGIGIDMSESERYEILKGKSIRPQKIEVNPNFNIDFEYLEKNIKSEIEKPLIKKLRELGYLKRYKTDAIEVDFEFTGGGLRKSLNSQATAYGGSFADLAKVVLNLQKLLDNSVLVEIHSDKGAGTDLENKQLVQTFVMMSAFAEGNSIVPVQFEVKQFVDNANRLYLAVALTKIETGVVGNTTLDKNQASTYLLPVSSISIADLFAKINIKDENFFKYIPDGFLSADQIDAKNRALAKDEAKYGKKTRDTADRINGLERPKSNEGYALTNGISNKSISQDGENVNKKFSTISEMGSHSISTMLEARYSSAVNDYLNTFIKDLNGAKAQNGGLLSFLSRGLTKFKKTKVAASLSVVVQQPTAIIRATSEIDARYFAHLPKIESLNKKWDRIQKYAPIAIIKDIGGFDAGSGRQITEWLNSDTRQGMNKAMNKLDDVTMYGAALGDRVGWGAIWTAVEREVQVKQNLKYGTEEFWQACGKRFTDVIVKTQVYDSTLSRSGFMRGKDGLMKMATAFMGEPTLSVNMLADTFLQAKRGTIKKRQVVRTVAAVYTATIAASIFKSLIYALRDDDEDESYAEKYLQAFGGSILNDINPLSMLPFYRDVVSVFDGWSVERSDIALIQDFYNATIGLFSENKTTWRKIEDFAGALGALAGVPAKNLLRTTREMNNAINDIFYDGIEGGDLGGAFVEGVTGKEKSKSQTLYEALIEGDFDRIRVLRKGYKTDDDFLEAVRAAMREHDPRIREAAAFYIIHDVGKKDELYHEILAEGTFSDEEIATAIKSEMDSYYNKIKEAAETKLDGNNEEYERFLDELFEKYGYYLGDDKIVDDIEAKVFSITETAEMPKEKFSPNNAYDANLYFDSGDDQTALDILDELMKNKTEYYFELARYEADKKAKDFDEWEAMANAEWDARESLRSSMTDYWKEKYQAAYKKSDLKEMERIVSILKTSGLYVFKKTRERNLDIVLEEWREELSKK